MEKPRYTSYDSHEQGTPHNEDCRLSLYHRFFLHENHSLRFAPSDACFRKNISYFSKIVKFFLKNLLQAVGVRPAGVRKKA